MEPELSDFGILKCLQANKISGRVSEFLDLNAESEIRVGKRELVEEREVLDGVSLVA